MKSAYPEFATATAKERIAEAETTEADALVTCCPHCEENLDVGLAETGSGMEVYNLLDLVLEATGDQKDD